MSSGPGALCGCVKHAAGHSDQHEDKLRLPGHRARWPEEGLEAVVEHCKRVRIYTQSAQVDVRTLLLVVVKRLNHFADALNGSEAMAVAEPGMAPDLVVTPVGVDSVPQLMKAGSRAVGVAECHVEPGPGVRRQRYGIRLRRA